MIEEKILGLLFVMVSLFILLAAFLYKLMRQTTEINDSLKDIARSQRILSKNPKDFDETKVIKEIEDKYKSPFD